MLWEAPGNGEQQNRVSHVTLSPGIAPEAGGPTYTVLFVYLHSCLCSFSPSPSFLVFVSLCLCLSLSDTHTLIHTHTYLPVDSECTINKLCDSTGNAVLPAPWLHPAYLLVDRLTLSSGASAPEAPKNHSDFLRPPRQKATLAAMRCVPFAFLKYPYHVASYKFTVLS